MFKSVDHEQEAKARLSAWDAAAEADRLKQQREIDRLHLETNLVFLEFVAEQVSRESDAYVPELVTRILEDRLTIDEKARLADEMDWIHWKFNPLNQASALSALTILQRAIGHD